MPAPYSRFYTEMIKLGMLYAGIYSFFRLLGEWLRG